MYFKNVFVLPFVGSQKTTLYFRRDRENNNISATFSYNIVFLIAVELLKHLYFTVPVLLKW